MSNNKLPSLPLEDFVKEFKSTSHGYHQRKFCFVLGAGASKTSGIKTGEELVEIWDKELEVRNPVEHAAWKKEHGITEENKYNFYSRYYERRFERDDGKRYQDGYNFLESMIEKGYPSSGYIYLALLMSQTTNNVVITTNFDHLLEDSLVQYAQAMPMVIGHERLAPYAMRQTSRPTVIKIHRDLLLDPINRTAESEELHPEWEAVLDHVFSEYHPVFIGYAGNDNSVMDFLNQNVDKFKNKWAYPYWMIYGDQEPEGKVYEFLEKSKGYLVHHRGFDQVCMLLCGAMGLTLPDKETFLKKPEVQYEMLLDSMGEFLKQYEIPASRIPVTDEYPVVKGSCNYESASAAYIKAIMSYVGYNFNQALAEAKRAVELEPNNVRYHYGLSIMYYKLNRNPEALEDARKIVRLNPQNAQFHNYLGKIFYKVGQYDEALIEVQKAVELEPKNPEYHHRLSMIFLARKEFYKAMQEAEKAVELEPKNPEYHYDLGVALHFMGRHEDALVEAEKSVEYDPKNDKYHQILDLISRSY